MTPHAADECSQYGRDAVAHGSAAAWRHFNLLGEYDFSEEKLRDGMGIRLPKLMN